MAHLLKLTANKTYATKENAVKAVEKKLGANDQHPADTQLHYLVIQNDEGRWFPLFIGERALQAGIHFHFNCVN